MATQAPQSRHPHAAQPPRQKILRIGVILGDKIVEEKLIRDRGPVSIGQSAKNTFPVPAPELPRSWPLFTVSGGRYVLHVADSMVGRTRAARIRANAAVCFGSELFLSAKIANLQPVISCGVAFEFQL